MQHTYLFWLSATILVYLYAPLTTAKCRGEWAFAHICRGGNGKRSGPPPALSDRENSLLSQLLLRNDEPPQQTDLDDLLNVYQPVYKNSDEAMPIVRTNTAWTNADLQRLSKLLDQYMYQKRLRTMTDDDFI